MTDPATLTEAPPAPSAEDAPAVAVPSEPPVATEPSLAAPPDEPQLAPETSIQAAPTTSPAPAAPPLPEAVPLVPPPAPEAPAASVVPDGPVSPLEALEYRIRRLEDAVAALQDTRLLEERVVERMADRLARNPAPNLREATFVVDANRRLPPPVAEVVSANHVKEGPAPLATVVAAAHGSWLLFDFVAEARAMVRMFVDPHYRLGWQAKVFPVLILGGIFLSWLWLGSIPLLGTWLDKVVDVVLAFFLYKVLSREARRYREVFAEMSARRRH